MKTMDRGYTQEFAATAPLRHDTRRTWWVMAVVAILGLGLGLVVGRLTAASGDESAYLVDGGQLSDRQEQMLDVLDAAVLGWRAGDANAVLATFTPTGILTWDARQYRVDDGTLPTFVEGGDWSTLRMFEPVLVDGNRLNFNYAHGDIHYLGAVEFTATGEVLATHQWIDL